MLQHVFLLGVFIVIACSLLAIALIYIQISSIKHKKLQKRFFKLEIQSMEEDLKRWKDGITNGNMSIDELMKIKTRIDMWSNTIKTLSVRYSYYSPHSWEYLKKYYTYDEAKEDIESTKRIMGYKE